ncbi:MAG: hypothetical protein LQ338_005342 [Usnochroma carphineum]|nr:MAG: hypothetical protein LQ338_005342 [Usnochroma carphineum]
MALAILSLLLQRVQAYPRPKRARLSTPALFEALQPLQHNAQTRDLPRPLTIRAPGNRPGNSIVEMRHLQFKALAAILPLGPAAQALYVCQSLPCSPFQKSVFASYSPSISPSTSVNQTADLGRLHREKFYQELAIAAANEWASRPRLQGFTYEEGGFRLAMQSWGDTIPWDFVQALANRLWECAALGMPYLFDLAYMSPDGRILVSIMLRLSAEAVAGAVGSNSAGSSQSTYGTTPSWMIDTNGLPGDDANGVWREGSVESVNSGLQQHP